MECEAMGQHYLFAGSVVSLIHINLLSLSIVGELMKINFVPHSFWIYNSLSKIPKQAVPIELADWRTKRKLK
jgi:hypothetical protein